MAIFRLRWRFFWSRRSRRRTLSALLLLFIALLAITYVAIPSTWQLRLQDGFLAVGRGVHSLGLTNALIAGVALCLIVSLFLIFVPTYRRHGYLTTDRHIIPPVSVYLDAENQIPAESVRSFRQYLIKHLNGRRCDLLFFLDARQNARGQQYKTLYHYGFRLVDVPHNLSGKGSENQAVDKEIAIHAFERALLGPPKQEFIIVTGDKDYVSLVYRLVALGHHVQIWAGKISPAYHALKSYLDIDLVELDPSPIRQESTVIIGGAPTIVSSGVTSVSTTAAHKRKSNYGRQATVVEIPEQATKAAEQRLLGVISHTLSIHARIEQSQASATEQPDHFRRAIATELSQELASIGYFPSKTKADYWIEHLVTMRVLLSAGEQLPALGPTTPEDASKVLLRVARVAAASVIVVAERRPSARVTVGDVANDLKTIVLPKVQAEPAVTAALLRLIASNNAKRLTHARYFVRIARALHFLEFDIVANEPDIVLNPRRPAYDASVSNAGTAVTTSELRAHDATPTTSVAQPDAAASGDGPPASP